MNEIIVLLTLSLQIDQFFTIFISFLLLQKKMQVADHKINKIKRKSHFHQLLLIILMRCIVLIVIVPEKC